MKKILYIITFVIILCVVIGTIVVLTDISNHPMEPIIIQPVSISPDTPKKVERPTPTPVSTTKRRQLNTVLPEPTDDDKKALAPFFTSLKSTAYEQVRVVHFGDSQIEGDRITSTMRNSLQQRYGGGGVGVLPLVKRLTALSYSLDTYDANGEELTRAEQVTNYFVYNFKKKREGNNHYGIMGQVFLMNDSLSPHSEQIVWRYRGNKYMTQRPFNRVRVLATDGISVTLSDNGTTRPVQNYVTTPITSTREVTLQLRGRGEVYGISIESERGVVVDNIAMRGASGLIFTQINRQQLTTFFEATNTRLIILQYGGNIVPYLKNEQSVAKYIKNMRRQVTYLRQCAPHASFLFIGPSDMFLQLNGVKQSPTIIPYLDEQLEHFCRTNNLAYYSLFQMMGGSGSMELWQEQNLAGNDGIHFSRKGSAIASNNLFQWFIKTK